VASRERRKEGKKEGGREGGRKGGKEGGREGREYTNGVLVGNEAKEKNNNLFMQMRRQHYLQHAQR
jgi:hypothetical protein